MIFLDKFLNSITTYRLVLNSLVFLTAISVILAAFDRLRYSWTVTVMVPSLLALLAACYFSNFIFSKVFNVPVNAESSLITAFILFLILAPADTSKQIMILVIAGVVAMASKYLLAPFRKHLFNPAAFAAATLYIFGLDSAVWWVGDPWMLPFVFITGFLIVRKIKRFSMVVSFFVAWLLSLSFFGRAIFSSFQSFFFALGPILFYATIMLTEPITTPPTKKLQWIYGALNGLLLNVPIRLGGFSATPEIVLMIGNVLSYATGSRRRYELTLKGKNEIAKDVCEFVFTPDRKINFKPGQYLEWTLAHDKKDSRGNRRYFTIASSPTEGDVKLGVKYNNPPSSFKRALFTMQDGDTFGAGQLGGDFVMPRDTTKKLVFIAGGIGITPFRSMIRFLLDKNERRDITLFYATKTEAEIAYRDIFTEAKNKLGIKTEYIVGRFIDDEFVRRVVPDYHERIFYISGPDAMVNTFKKMLLKMNVPRRSIITDYFPGFA